MARQFLCPVCRAAKIEYPIRRCATPHGMVRQLLTPLADPAILAEAERVAHAIDATIGELHTSPEFATANSLGANSSQIQTLLTPTLLSAGFEAEKKARSEAAEFRPDFTKMVGESGILAEIERGKTLDNNMDMLDMWKTHVHKKANHLILIVPIWYETSKIKRTTFATVCRRMEPFFVEGFYSNVHSLHVVGY